MADDKIFKKLRSLRDLERKLLPFVLTVEDRDIVLEIGYHSEIRRPIGVKQLHTLRIGSESTIRRRLNRLRKKGLVQQQRADHDRRNLNLKLHASVQAACRRIHAALRK
jgi:DNA-binding MarR family transcriptional regulator